MIIILKTDATKENADVIQEKISSLGLKPLYLPGEEKIVLGAIGDERQLEKLNLDSFSFVEKVIPILKPYKLASRQMTNQTNSIVKVGDVEIGGKKLVTMAGPCSVESEEQIVQTAIAVKKAGANILRGGAFKPRTSPYAFQGMEEDGLKLLQTAKQETGLPIVTEVLSEFHVDLVGKYTDMFQLGARNMQNFRLLKAIGQTDIPVLLKRGPVASLSELLMSAEYILSEGNPNVVLCERGIKSFNNDTRNTFDLSMIPLLKRETHLPVIADPSHGTGVRDLISPMSKAAIAAGADGLMIEVHPNPGEALSDGFQQITPDQFAILFAELQKVARAVDKEM